MVKAHRKAWIQTQIKTLLLKQNGATSAQIPPNRHCCFVSVLRYALGLFCPIRIKPDDPNHTSINGIKVIYNDLLRLLCSSKRENRKPIQEMLDQVGWLSINQMSCEIRLIEVWKSLNLKNYCLKELFERINSSQTTRSENQIRLKANFKTRLKETSFHYPSVQVWNSAPPLVKKSPIIISSKKSH